MHCMRHVNLFTTCHIRQCVATLRNHVVAKDPPHGCRNPNPEPPSVQNLGGPRFGGVAKTPPRGGGGILNNRYFGGEVPNLGLVEKTECPF